MLEEGKLLIMSGDKNFHCYIWDFVTVFVFAWVSQPMYGRKATLSFTKKLNCVKSGSVWLEVISVLHY